MFRSSQFISQLVIKRSCKADFLFLQNIGINIRCYTNVAVTKMLGDHFQVYTAVEDECSVAMPQHPEKTLLRNYFAAINSNRKFVMCIRDSFI